MDFKPNPASQMDDGIFELDIQYSKVYLQTTSPHITHSSVACYMIEKASKVLAYCLGIYTEEDISNMTLIK